MTPSDQAPRVPSPCISVCQIEDDGRCAGCTRSIEQIEAWTLYDDAERMQVWMQLAQHFDIELEAALSAKIGREAAREVLRAHPPG